MRFDKFEKEWEVNIVGWGRLVILYEVNILEIECEGLVMLLKEI